MMTRSFSDFGDDFSSFAPYRSTRRSRSLPPRRSSSPSISRLFVRVLGCFSLAFFTFLPPPRSLAALLVSLETFATLLTNVASALIFVLFAASYSTVE